MNDTTAEVQAEFRQRLRATDASRRLSMMSEMFGAAKSLAKSSLPDNSDAPEAALFKRMYRTDFSPTELAAIAEHLEAVHVAGLKT